MFHLLQKSAADKKDKALASAVKAEVASLLKMKDELQKAEER